MAGILNLTGMRERKMEREGKTWTDREKWREKGK